jgi:protein-disulfide isomerase
LDLENGEIYDPNCSVRPGIIAKVEGLAEQGKTKQEILDILEGKSSGASSVSEDDDPSIGPKDAKVVIIEFSDFQCPFCSKAESTVKQILAEYEGKVRFVYRDYPLSFHQFAQKAAEAAECADEQGKFWEYHDLLFDKQNEWSSNGVLSFKQYAKDIGLDSQKFDQCLDSGQMASEVKKDFSDGQSYGVNGTPAFFVNGEMISGAQPFSVFKQKIDALLK